MTLRHLRGDRWDQAVAGAAQRPPALTRPAGIEARLGALDASTLAELSLALRAERSWARELFLDALSTGERWAWTAFHAWYHPAVEAICTRILGDRDLGRDLAATVCLAFVEKYATHERARATFPGYLLRMARTRACKQKAASTRLDPFDDGGPRPPAGAADVVSPEGVAVYHQRRDRVRKAVASLSTDDQAYLAEWLVAGDVYREIGARHGVSTQAAWKRIKRIVARAKDLLHDL